MKINEFIGKYKIIIFLVVMIFILAFIKNYFGNKIEENNSKTTVNVSNNSETSEIVNNTNNNNTETLNEEITPKVEKPVSENEVEELIKTYDSLETEEEQDAFLNNLSDEQQDALLAEEPTEEYGLENDLPYETNTFVAMKYASENVLIVKAKGDNFEKSESDIKDWLKEATTNPDDIVLIWED